MTSKTKFGFWNRPSPAFVRQPEGNGCIERFFRTLKEQLLWIRSFQDLGNCAPRSSSFASVQPPLDRRATDYRTPAQARRHFHLALELAA